MDANSEWLWHISRIMSVGQESEPRGMKTKELVSAATEINMNYPVVTSPGRKMGYRFMAREAWWILSGRDDVASIAPYSKEISKFSDDGLHFFGAYGPKIMSQYNHVVMSLSQDSDSRQAVINIWRESPPPTKDVPCTLSVQFLIRDGKLHCIDTMRSSDAWLGWVYDVFNFSMLSALVVLTLRRRFDHLEHLGLGNLYLNAGSAHIYERNFEAVEKILKTEANTGSPCAFDIDEFGIPLELVHHLKALSEGQETRFQSFKELYK